MTTLTNTINEIALTLEMNTMDIYESINMHNLTSEHDQIESEDEIRKHLIEIAFNSRLIGSGKEVYSKVCDINDSYFKAKCKA